MVCSEFVPEPVTCVNDFKADTSAPSAEDAHIAAIADPTDRAQQRWERYLQWLSGEAIGNMLNVTVLVILRITVHFEHYSSAI